MKIVYTKGELPPNYDRCPELKFTYRGRKSGKAKIYWHTPNVFDGGICVYGQLENDGYYHIQLLDDSFWGETIVDEIKFKLEVNKEYTIYMRKEYPRRIYATAHYERVNYEVPKEESKPSSNAFDKLTPDHMLRLIRLANPQCISDKIFSEFALEASN